MQRKTNSTGEFNCHRRIKKDLFGSIEEGEFIKQGQAPVPAIRRVVSASRWWTRPLAKHFAWREQRALQALAGLDAVPELLRVSRHGHVRSKIEGDTMRETPPTDPQYFHEGFRLLVKLQRAGLTHNDLAKEPNWLVTTTGKPSLVDFQLTTFSPRRGRLFRVLCREDLRHLLKHKRKYFPDALTQREKNIISTPSVASQWWRSVVKRLYKFISRRIFHWSDREGARDKYSP